MVDSIKQKKRSVAVEGRTIEVRRMRWKAAREFLRKLGAAVAGLIKGGGGTGSEGFSIAGVVSLLPELIAQTDELATHLVINSTDLTAEQFDGLDALEAAEVLRTAVEINLDDEIKNSFAGIAERAAALMPAVKAAPAATTI